MYLAYFSLIFINPKFTIWHTDTHTHTQRECWNVIFKNWFSFRGSQEPEVKRYVCQVLSRKDEESVHCLWITWHYGL